MFTQLHMLHFSFSSSTGCQTVSLKMEANVNNPNLTDKLNLVVEGSLSNAADSLDNVNMASSSDLHVEAKLNNPSSDDNPENPDMACSSKLNVASQLAPNTASNIAGGSTQFKMPLIRCSRVLTVSGIKTTAAKPFSYKLLQFFYLFFSSFSCFPLFSSCQS